MPMFLDELNDLLRVNTPRGKVADNTIDRVPLFVAVYLPGVGRPVMAAVEYIAAHHHQRPKAAEGGRPATPELPAELVFSVQLPAECLDRLACSRERPKPAPTGETTRAPDPKPGEEAGPEVKPFDGTYRVENERHARHSERPPAGTDSPAP